MVLVVPAPTRLVNGGAVTEAGLGAGAGAVEDGRADTAGAGGIVDTGGGGLVTGEPADGTLLDPDAGAPKSVSRPTGAGGGAIDGVGPAVVL